MTKENKDYGKSIKAKLLNLSKAEGLSYQPLLIHYMQERLLYRLAQSKYKHCFYLKGGALLYAHEHNGSHFIKKAIHATLKNRGTIYEENHPLFNDDFPINPRFQMLWKSFMKKIRKAKPDFETVVRLIKEKLFPYWEKYKEQ